MSEACGFHPNPVSHSQMGWQRRVSSQQTEVGGEWHQAECASPSGGSRHSPRTCSAPASLWEEPSNWSYREICAPFNPCSWELCPSLFSEVALGPMPGETAQARSHSICSGVREGGYPNCSPICCPVLHPDPARATLGNESPTSHLPLGPA